MKVLQIIPAFVMGGAETMCETLSLELNKQGIDVVVVSLFSMRTPISKRIEAAGIKVVYLDKRRGYDFLQIAKLYKLFKEEKPDVIHMHLNSTAFAVPAAVLAGVKKRIYTVHHIAQKDGGKINKVLNWAFIHFFEMIPVALSEENRKTIFDVYHPRQERVPVIWNGVNLDQCIEKENYKSNARFRLIHIGRFEEPKNHEVLVDAASQIAAEARISIHLKMIGKGKLLERIKEKSGKDKNLRERVTIIEGLDSCFHELSESDLFVLPSKWEGMPMTLIEAMGTGLPCIASKVGGIPDMIDDGVDGLLIEPTVDSLKTAIERVCSNESLRIALGMNAKKKARAYSSKNMAIRYIQLYSE